MISANEINKSIAMDMLHGMPDNKKESLKKALDRNFILTSTYILEHGQMTIYKEGWYLELLGTRCKFSVYAQDNDGEFIFKRKPHESKLRKLYTDHFKFGEGDFDEFK